MKNKQFKEKLYRIIFSLTFIWIFIFNSAEAKIVEVAPHIFIDSVESQDWFLNGQSEIIFAGCGSPIFPNKKTHYLDYKTIKYGTLKDGRFIITCNFYNMYEFAVFYKGDKNDDSRRARFVMRDTVDSNISPFEIDPVIAEFNGQYLEPFPAVGKSPIPNRVAEMLYYMVKGEKFYGNLNPELFINDSTHQDILNPYTQDLYDRCKVKNSRS
ncbi:MAG: hypothetical protein IKZ58_07520 [Selenomonadaceae bacterium]|nr:hypothetical protein [Selenomonadaceae bacterium]